jgi:hypothetical protein
VSPQIQFGVNVTQDGSDFPAGEVGPWRRFVVSDDRAVEIARRYRDNGSRVIAVASKQVIHNLGNNTQTTPARFFDLFGFCDAVQVWNEPDGAGSESDITDRNTYQTWLWAFRDEASRRQWKGTLLAAGLVSGNPSYLMGLDMSGGYHLCLHPYDQRPYADYPDWGHGDIDSLLDAYRPYLPAGTKYWLTECARTTQMELVQANYASTLIHTLVKREDVDAALWYCWKDWHLGSVARPFGMVREDRSPKPTLAAWIQALREVGVVDETARWADDKQRIEEQISLLVENQRRILMGDWDSARIFLDAIDPAMAGKWTNCNFTGCDSGEV